MLWIMDVDPGSSSSPMDHSCTQVRISYYHRLHASNIAHLLCDIQPARWKVESQLGGVTVHIYPLVTLHPSHPPLVSLHLSHPGHPPPPLHTSYTHTHPTRPVLRPAPCAPPTCIVLPRPMSSARMPFRPRSCSATSQRRPCRQHAGSRLAYTQCTTSQRRPCRQHAGSRLAYTQCATSQRRPCRQHAGSRLAYTQCVMCCRHHSLPAGCLLLMVVGGDVAKVLPRKCDKRGASPSPPPPPCQVPLKLAPLPSFSSPSACIWYSRSLPPFSPLPPSHLHLVLPQLAPLEHAWLLQYVSCVPGQQAGGKQVPSTAAAAAAAAASHLPPLSPPGTLA